MTLYKKPERFEQQRSTDLTDSATGTASTRYEITPSTDTVLKAVRDYGETMYKLARVASPHKRMYTNHLKTYNQLKGMVIIATRFELLRHQFSALVNSLCLQSLD